MRVRATLFGRARCARRARNNPVHSSGLAFGAALSRRAQHGAHRPRVARAPLAQRVAPVRANGRPDSLGAACCRCATGRMHVRAPPIGGRLLDALAGARPQPATGAHHRYSPLIDPLDTSILVYCISAQDDMSARDWSAANGRPLCERAPGARQRLDVSSCAARRAHLRRAYGPGSRSRPVPGEPVSVSCACARLGATSSGGVAPVRPSSEQWSSLLGALSFGRYQLQEVLAPDDAVSFSV